MAHCRLAIELDPNFWFAHWMLALAHWYQGLKNDALSIAERAVELFGRYSLLLMCLGGAYAVTGRTAEARQILEELKTRSRATYVQPFAIATIHLALGELDQGMEWTATAVEERDLLAVYGLKSDPFYAPLRSHPAFQALLRKMNLEP